MTITRILTKNSQLYNYVLLVKCLLWLMQRITWSKMKTTWHKKWRKPDPRKQWRPTQTWPLNFCCCCKTIKKGRSYLLELFRQITSNLPEQFRQITSNLQELFRQITSYLPELKNLTKFQKMSSDMWPRLVRPQKCRNFFNLSRIARDITYWSTL